MSAHQGRAILGQVLGECVADGKLDVAGAEAAGVGVLRENATGLYRLQS